MTRYERGFLSKCAEAGLPPEQAGMLLKRASGVGRATGAVMESQPTLGSSLNFFSKTLRAFPDVYRRWRDPRLFRHNNSVKDMTGPGKKA